uniref:Uncharacterized protein ycf33 n=1 Tax=Ptilothamnion sphaericum TaxID=1498216 RepID=A0A4D6WXS8_9FLOR|nr:hypothetical protein [Ptilothamnion sphaericum]
MYYFWDNIYKFPRFLIGTLLGFFLTTFKPIFQLLKKTKIAIIVMIVTMIIIYNLYILIKLMTGIN